MIQAANTLGINHTMRTLQTLHMAQAANTLGSHHTMRRAQATSICESVGKSVLVQLSVGSERSTLVSVRNALDC